MHNKKNSDKILASARRRVDINGSFFFDKILDVFFFQETMIVCEFCFAICCQDCKASNFGLLRKYTTTFCMLTMVTVRRKLNMWLAPSHRHPSLLHGDWMHPE